MGNAASEVAKKIKSCIKNDKQSLSLFEQLQNASYTKQVGQKSIEHMINIGDFGNFNSLKKVHRHIHPALKYIEQCQSISNQNKQQSIQKSNDANFLRIHEEDLIGSAGSVLFMYYQYLNRVVPANISYFHFMREKDFYTHYCALKYVLAAGQAGTMFKSSSKSIDIFNRLKTDHKLLYAKLISHWLYDMVKYRCSAIYLQSKTLPFLIVINAVVLCALLFSQKINLLEQFDRRENNSKSRNQIYQHCLYSLTYILSEAHFDKKLKSTQGNGCLQIILLGTSNLLNLMWQNSSNKNIMHQAQKSMFCPSYWYVQSIGFVKSPTLQNLFFLITLDIIFKINRKQEQHVSQNKPQNKKRKWSLKNLGCKKNSDQYKTFKDEKQISQPEQGKQQKLRQVLSQSQELSINKEKPEAITLKGSRKKQLGSSAYTQLNTISHMLLYHCIQRFLQYQPSLITNPSLQKVLINEIKQLAPNSFIRPFVLSIIRTVLNQSRTNNSGVMSESERNTTDINQSKVDKDIVEYEKKNQMSYSTNEYIIPEHIVGKNCNIFLNKLFPKMLQNYGRQIYRSDGEIWGQILKYNTHQMSHIGQ